MFAKQNCVSIFLVKVFAKQKSLFIYAGIIIGDRNGAFVGRS